MNKEKEKVVLKNLKKSNVLISSIYKASILEVKTIFVALSNIQMGKYEKKADGVYVNIQV